MSDRRVYDPMTGEYLDADWLAERRVMERDIMRDWDKGEGTCMDCNLPMRLHPSARFYNRNPAFCDIAREAASHVYPAGAHALARREHA